MCIRDRITSPAMTAEWENTLMEIERGNADADTFLSGIVQMTGDLVKAYPFLSDACLLYTSRCV